MGNEDFATRLETIEKSLKIGNKMGVGNDFSRSFISQMHRDNRI